MKSIGHKNRAGQVDYYLRILDQEWNEKLLQITREHPVQAGSFQILFDRSPNVFTIPHLASYKTRCLGLFKKDKLLGYAMASYQKRYLNNNIANVIYFGNMQVVKRGLGQELLKQLEKRYEQIIPHGTGVSHLYAYVMEDNMAAMKLVDLGHLFSRVIGQISMTIILMLLPLKPDKKYRIRQATLEDIDEIVGLLSQEYSQRFLAPEINRDIFKKNLAVRPQLDISDYYLALSGSEIVGVCSAWDMTAFKKNIVLNYGVKMGTIRFLYNMMAGIFKSPTLPKIGIPFRDITIAEYAVKNRDKRILESLLRHIYYRYRKEGYHSMIIGSSVNDRLLEATNIFISKKVHSNVILGAAQKSKITEIEKQSLLYADALQL